jgi:hypothetical protein
MEYLFDPMNPTDSSKFFAPPKPTDKLLRFSAMRDPATDQEGASWA